MGLIDKTKHEVAALEAASEAAGEFIDSLPTSDMSRWTVQQWQQFIEVVVSGFTHKMGELAATEAPF